MPSRFKIQTPTKYLKQRSKVDSIFSDPRPFTTMADDEHGPPKNGGNDGRLNSHRRTGESFTFQPSSRPFIPVFLSLVESLDAFPPDLDFCDS